MVVEREGRDVYKLGLWYEDEREMENRRRGRRRRRRRDGRYLLVWQEEARDEWKWLGSFSYKVTMPIKCREGHASQRVPHIPRHQNGPVTQMGENILFFF